MKFLRPHSLFPTLSALLLPVALSGCRTVVERVSPDPGVPVAPEEYRRANSGLPEVESLEAWWTIFGDAQLNELMAQVPVANPDVAAARARVDQALAAIGITRASRIPTITGEGSFTRRRDSANNLIFPIDVLEYDQYRLGVSASWEIDLWGRLRAATKRDRLSAEAAAERYENAILSIRSTLARNYLNLLYLEAETAILDNAVAVRQDALDLQNSRVERGAATELESTRARTELETARTDLEGLERTQGKLEHAIAVLVGQAPANLDVASDRSLPHPPRVPAGVPSELLIRRGDVRAAWYDLEAASEQVGITFAEFLPKFRLTGSGGVASLSASTLFASDSIFFDIGPQVELPLFQGGRRKATVGQARARMEEELAEWRSILLVAVREVDDSLYDIQVLDRQIAAATRAAEAAAETVRLSRLQYDRGLVSYLDVVEAERTRLQTDRTLNALRGERAVATVQLIQALGGGW